MASSSSAAASVITVLGLLVVAMALLDAPTPASAMPNISDADLNKMWPEIKRSDGTTVSAANMKSYLMEHMSMAAGRAATISNFYAGYTKDGFKNKWNEKGTNVH